MSLVGVSYLLLIIGYIYNDSICNCITFHTQAMMSTSFHHVLVKEGIENTAIILHINIW